MLRWSAPWRAATWTPTGSPCGAEPERHLGDRHAGQVEDRRRSQSPTAGRRCAGAGARPSDAPDAAARRRRSRRPADPPSRARASSSFCRVGRPRRQRLGENASASSAACALPCPNEQRAQARPGFARLPQQRGDRCQSLACRCPGAPPGTAAAPCASSGRLTFADVRAGRGERACGALAGVAQIASDIGLSELSSTSVTGQTVERDGGRIAELHRHHELIHPVRSGHDPQQRQQILGAASQRPDREHLRGLAGASTATSRCSGSARPSACGRRHRRTAPGSGSSRRCRRRPRTPSRRSRRPPPRRRRSHRRYATGRRGCWCGRRAGSRTRSRASAPRCW